MVYDRLTGKHYHLQIEIFNNNGYVERTVRLSHARFSNWVRYLRELGHSLSIEYDNDHHTYTAIAKEGA